MTKLPSPDDGPAPDKRDTSAPVSAAGMQQRQTFSADGAWLDQTMPGLPNGGAGTGAARGPTRLLVCGDIGGTKVLLALAEQQGSGLRWRLQRRYLCAHYPDLAAMFADFMRIAADAALYPGDITGGCLAVAGPVSEHGRRAKLTNLPWEIDAAALAADHGTGPIRLVNDFAAAAAGVDAVEPADLVELQAGEPEKRGVRLVIGAGTGLGVATLVWHGGADGGYRPLAGEGGHLGFAPTDELQVELWRHLKAQGLRVSNEHIVAGPGLMAVYQFLQQRAQAAPDSLDTPEKIAAQAAQEPQGIAAQALQLFFRIYGAAAGDLALAVMPRGGVYIAGGIAARLLPQMRASSFVEAFNGKAPHAGLIQRLPLRVITDLDLGLKGAARIACGWAQV
ncbi:MAG TPA: glucokinase [Burkholderiales bacterium]|nr:glucokinase [Burkholderiales bacterium]